MLYYFKRIATSRLGQSLMITHLVVVIYLFAQMPSQSDMPCYQESISAGHATIAGRYFHWTYEPMLMLVALFDLPAVFVSSLVESLLSRFDWCEYSKSWVLALNLLFFTSLQWLMIGAILESFITFRKSRKRLKRDPFRDKLLANY